MLPATSSPSRSRASSSVTGGGVGRVCRVQRRSDHEGEHRDDEHNQHAGDGDLPCHPAAGGLDNGGIGVQRRLLAHLLRCLSGPITGSSLTRRGRRRSR